MAWAAARAGPEEVHMAKARIALMLSLLGALAAGCDRGPSCEDAAERMVALANEPVGDDEATKPEARERLASACESEPWPPEIRRCLIAASDQEEATACMRDLGATP